MTSHEALRAGVYEFLEQISLTPGSDWDGAREGILQSCLPIRFSPTNQGIDK